MTIRAEGRRRWVCGVDESGGPLACGVIGAGCRSAQKPAANRFAAVEIRGNTPGQIRDITVEVFREKGYTMTQAGLKSMVFGKESSKLSNIAYGNWMDKPVWVRVNVSIVPAGEAAFRLECDARLLRNSGEPVEEEIKMSRVRRGPYQKLLNEVASRLNGSQIR